MGLTGHVEGDNISAVIVTMVDVSERDFHEFVIKSMFINNSGFFSWSC